MSARCVEVKTFDAKQFPVQKQWKRRREQGRKKMGDEDIYIARMFSQSKNKYASVLVRQNDKNDSFSQETNKLVKNKCLQSLDTMPPARAAKST